MDIEQVKSLYNVTALRRVLRENKVPKYNTVKHEDAARLIVENGWNLP
jgi:hypothetical protein